MKKFRKLTLLLCAQLLVMGTFAGCAKTDAPADSGSVSTTTEGNTGEKKPLEITIAHWDVEKGLAKGEDDKVLVALEEKFNVKFKPMNISWDDYAQKIQLWAASGSLPDIFSMDAIGTAYYHDWIEQGVLKALPEDLSAYPNLVEYLDVEDIQALKIDGRLYCIPRKTYPDNYWNAIDRVVLYRWDLAQKAGVTKEPETWEEFQDMMKKIIAADPEGKNIGGLTTTQANLLEGWLFTYSLPAASGGEYKWVEKDGQYIPAYFAGDALSTFKLARELYTSGVIEKDIALVKQQQSQDKFLQGQSAAILQAGGPIKLYDYAGKYWSEIYPGRDILEDVKMLKLLPGKDGQKYFPLFRTSWSESYISSQVSDEKLARILEIYDFLASEEGNRLLNYGFEGEDYDIVDGKVVLRNPEELSEKYAVPKYLSTLLQWGRGVWDVNLPVTVPEPYRAMNIEKYNEAKTEGVMPEFDMRYTYLSTPLKDRFIIPQAQDLLTIMMGTEPVEKMYEDLLAQYESKGLSAMIKEVNDTAKELGWQ